jgi:hypothetical protein
MIKQCDEGADCTFEVLLCHVQVVTIRICDSQITGRPDVGYVKFPLVRMPSDGRTNAWLPVQVHCAFLSSACSHSSEAL